MSTTTSVKKKLCWNCDGDVSMEASICPYCASPLEMRVDSDLDKINQDPLYTEKVEEIDNVNIEPTYSQTISAEESSKMPLFETGSQTGKSDVWKISDQEWKELTESDQNKQSAYTVEKSSVTLLPLALLLAGSIFFVFSLAQYFFSIDGTLSLSWNSSYWWFYFAFGAGLSYFGWKALEDL